MATVIVRFSLSTQPSDTRALILSSYASGLLQEFVINVQNNRLDLISADAQMQRHPWFYLPSSVNSLARCSNLVIQALQTRAG